jgi:hypothetical protein
MNCVNSQDAHKDMHSGIYDSPLILKCFVLNLNFSYLVSLTEVLPV